MIGLPLKRVGRRAKASRPYHSDTTHRQSAELRNRHGSVADLDHSDVPVDTRDFVTMRKCTCLIGAKAIRSGYRG